MESENKNYYELLEVPIGSAQDEIYEGYIRSKNAYSGDSIALYSLMSEDECHEMIVLIEEAYSVLSDPVKRKQYDNVRGFNQDSSNTSTLDKIKEHSFDRTPEQRANQERVFENQVLDAQEARKKNFLKQENFSINQNDKEVSRITVANKFSLNFTKNETFEQEIENTTEFTGDFLRKIREYKNVSLERMAEMTKISKTYIRHIESNDHDKLPAFAYIRGFVFQYAKCLKLNPDLVATSYLHQLRALKNEKSA